MGKAALDLPDPLQSPPEGPKASTDELLAQLAGDEIDRLLAEAEAVEPRASRAPFHVAPPTSPESSAEPQPSPATPPPTAEPGESTSAELDVAAEMDALFTAATAKDQAAAEAEMSAAERDGLKTPAGVAESVAAPAPAEADDAPLPLYLRPLEWLSAPLMILPGSVRDIVGKIAIVSLLNAAVILAYVLIVRRGH